MHVQAILRHAAHTSPDEAILERYTGVPTGVIPSLIEARSSAACSAGSATFSFVPAVVLPTVQVHLIQHCGLNKLRTVAIQYNVCVGRVSTAGCALQATTTTLTWKFGVRRWELHSYGLTCSTATLHPCNSNFVVPLSHGVDVRVLTFDFVYSRLHGRKDSFSKGTHRSP